MDISYKTAEEIEFMRKGGKILGAILLDLAKMTQPGVTTKMLDNRARELMKKYGVKPSFLGYHGFPGVICTPVNNEVVHTIPNDKPLQEGDVLTIDGGVIYEGFHTDSAISVGVGTINKEAQRMIRVGEEALHAGIQTVGPGVPIKDISRNIEHILKKNGMTVIRELIGHGIGRKLHEDPQMPNCEADASNFKLKPGMTIAIEPIFYAGKGGIKTLSDGWNIVTADGSLAMQVEHTIAITENGYEILTQREDLDPVYPSFSQS